MLLYGFDATFRYQVFRTAMSAFDPQEEESSETIGLSLGRRPLARKKLSEMVEEELEHMIRRREFAEGEQLPSERELMTFLTLAALRYVKRWRRLSVKVWCRSTTVNAHACHVLLPTR